MKVAICLSGELRGVKFTLPRLVKKFREYFGEESEIHYFVYCSNRKLKVTYWLNLIFGENHVTYIDDEDIKTVNQYCNPKLFKIEYDYDLLRKKIMDGGIYTSDMDVDDSSNAHGNSNFREFGQFHCAEQSIQLMCEYEKNNNIFYDVVVRTRTDIVIGDLKKCRGGKFESKIIDRWDGYGVCVTGSGIRNGRLIIGDLYFIGSRDVMVNYHKDLIEKLCAIYREKNKLNENDIFYNLLLDLRQGERKWALASMFTLTTIYNYYSDVYDPFPISLIRDHYEKNTWTEMSNIDQRMEQHGYFVMYFNDIVAVYIGNKNYSLHKITEYFKNNNMFDVLKSRHDITPFFENNSNLFTE